jgi:ABC-type multidrug transport system ATPase subunit
MPSPNFPQEAVSQDHSSPFIECVGLSKVLSERWVLRDVSIALRPKERILLYGPNGAGKTTLLKLLCGIQRPTCGSIRLFGHPIEQLPRDFFKNLGLVLSRGFFTEELSIEENLIFFGKLYGMSRTLIFDRIEALLRWSHLRPFRNSPVLTLSTGQRQRLALIRACLHNPQLLILDEPFNGLDEEALGFVKDIFKEPRTILFTSHDLEFAKGLSNAVWLIKGGRIIAQFRTDRPSLEGTIKEALA